jgi:hypothetical protein
MTVSIAHARVAPGSMTSPAQILRRIRPARPHPIDGQNSLDELEQKKNISRTPFAC